MPMTLPSIRPTSYRSAPPTPAERAATAKAAAAAKASAVKAAAAERAAAARAAAVERAAQARAAVVAKADSRKQAAPVKAVPLYKPTPVVTAPATRSQAAAAPEVPKLAPPPVAAKPAPAAPSASSTVAADGSLVAAGGRVSVDILQSESAYENQIYWSSDNFATRHLIGVDNRTGTVDLGSFEAGTRIDFGIHNGEGQFFRTGAASANSDGVQHARTSAAADGQQIGFEDLSGGGDRDFNDAIIRVRGLAGTPPAAAPGPVVTPPPPPAAAPGPVVPPMVPAPNPSTVPVREPAYAEPEGNRSGLGDGSNPGQGAGRTHSPNEGTQNPNQASPKHSADPSPAAVSKNQKLLASAYGSFAG